MARFLSYWAPSVCSRPARRPAYLPGVRQARAVEGHVQEEAHTLAALGGLLGLQAVDDLGEAEAVELGERLAHPQEGVVVGVGRVEAGLVAERVIHVGLRQPGHTGFRWRSGTGGNKLPAPHLGIFGSVWTFEVVICRILGIYDLFGQFCMF